MDDLGISFYDDQAFVTRAGLPLTLRRVMPEDAAALVDLLSRLSERTRMLRYFTPRPFSLELAWVEAERMVRGHAGDALTLVLASSRVGTDELFAVAELVPDAHDPGLATLALVVRDDYQGQGLGRVLAEQIVRWARQAGKTTLRVDLLDENRAMRRLLDRLGAPYTTTTSYGETTATLDLAASVRTRGGPFTGGDLDAAQAY